MQAEGENLEQQEKFPPKVPIRTPTDLILQLLLRYQYTSFLPGAICVGLRSCRIWKGVVADFLISKYYGYFPLLLPAL